MLAYLNKTFHTPNWLFALLSVVLILRIPSFFEPYYYGDEMIYLALGEGMRQGVPLYSGIHDNKPPLLYIIAAISGSLFWFKAILAIWSLITIYIFWKFTEVVFPKSEKSQKIATVIFSILTTIPLLEGNIANAELFMIGPTILGFYLLIAKKLNAKRLILAGTLFSVSALFKMPAVFDIPAIFVYWLLSEKKLNSKALLNIAKNTFVLLSAFLAPIFATFIWYWAQGSFQEYIIAAYLQNVGYLSSWRPEDVEDPFLVKNGPLLLRAVIVFVSLVILFIKRNKLSKKFIFITSWLFLSLFAATLSERPYPHYLIQSVPAISLLVGILTTSTKMEQVYAIIPLLFASLVPLYYEYYHYETLSYYQRFASLTTGKISKTEYLSSFGSAVPANYEISNFLANSTSNKDKVFVWGDSSAIYALSKRLPPGKYVADYHIKDFSSETETMTILEKQMPSFIVIQPNTEVFNELEMFIANNYGLVEEVDGAKIYKLLSLQVRTLLSD